jgi:hypothetical protein
MLFWGCGQGVQLVGLWNGGMDEATRAGGGGVVAGCVRVCGSGCEMMLRCVGDGGRPAVGRAGAGVCSGVRGAGVLVYLQTFNVGVGVGMVGTCLGMSVGVGVGVGVCLWCGWGCELVWVCLGVRLWGVRM